MPESVKNNDVFNKMASMSLDDVVAETRRRADTVKKNTGMELDNDGYAVVMTGVLYPEMNNASYQLYQKDLQTYQSMVPVIQDLVKVASGDSSMQEFVSRQEKRFRDGGDNDEQGTQRT